MRFPNFASRAAVGALVLALAGPYATHARAGQPAAGSSCNGAPPARHVTSNPISCAVDCRAGGTIAAALALSQQTTGGLTITIRGVCTEAVDFVPSGVTLHGSAAGDGLVAPSRSTNPVLGISGQNVTLNNLTISGGANPLLVHANAGVTGNSLVIEGASPGATNQNVLAQGVITLNNPTILASGGDGIAAADGGTVLLNGGVVENNAGRGIYATRNAQIFVDNGTVISQNGSAGGWASDGGVIFVNNGTFLANKVWGIQAQRGAQITLGNNNAVVSQNAVGGVNVFGGTFSSFGGIIAENSGNGINFNIGMATVQGTVSGNTGDGVFVRAGNIDIGGQGGAATIRSNGGNGVYLKSNSVAQMGNTANQIVGNTGWGILCDGPPANPLISPTPPSPAAIGAVSGNGAGQINCNIAP